jgi:hypothetical protein
MMAAMVTPLGWRNIASTVSCLEEAVDFEGDGFEATVFDGAGGFGGAEVRLLVERATDRADLVAVFVDFDLRLLVAI